MSSKIRRHDSKLNALFRLADNLLIIVFFALFLHYAQELDQAYSASWRFSDLMVLFSLILFYNYFSESMHVYRCWRGGDKADEALSIFISWLFSWSITALLAMLFLPFNLLLEWEIPLTFLFIGAIPLGILAFHWFLRFIIRHWIIRNELEQNVVIYGATSLGRTLQNAFEKTLWNGFQFKGFYDDRNRLAKSRRQGVEIEGGINELVSNCRNGEVDRIYITMSLAAEHRVKYILHRLADTTASVYLVPDMFTFNLLFSRVEDHRGIMAISIYESPIYGVDQFVKRVEDIVLSSCILVVICIPMVFIAIGVKLSSPGPVFFKQLRYGKSGKKIEVWKFRSMSVMENGDKVTQATKNDPRVTKFGAFIRKTSLDELPQFINVLQGRMSVIGPRPHAVSHNEEYRGMILGYMLRHKIKPGITGLAQVKGYRGETDTIEKMEKRIFYDLEYIKHWSLLMDAKIFFLTLFKGFSSKTAY
jgi:putative colanic acid biosynthesis UDP-glucose lipid carrier transferase